VHRHSLTGGDEFLHRLPVRRQAGPKDLAIPRAHHDAAAIAGELVREVLGIPSEIASSTRWGLGIARKSGMPADRVINTPRLLRTLAPGAQRAGSAVPGALPQA
jgi:hypothetical protein